MSPIQKWSFGGIDLCTKAWSVAVESLKGIGVPSKRGDDLKVPYIYGERHRTKMFNPRVISLPMWVKGVDSLTGTVPAGKTARDVLHENIDYLSSIFTTRTQVALRRTFPDGEIAREAQAEVVNEVEFQRQNPLFARFVVDFKLADPFFYGLTQKSETTTIDSNPEAWTHTNPGTAPAIKMEIKFYGPLDKPKLTNTTNGIWVQYNGTIGAGEVVTIDTAAFTVDKDGDNMISALKHQGSPLWFILERGDNDLKVECDEAPDGQVRIRYYPAYS